MKIIIELTKINDIKPNILNGKLVENFKMSNEIKEKNQHFNLKLIITIHILLLHITINKQPKQTQMNKLIQMHMQISETSCVFLFLQNQTKKHLNFSKII